MWVVGGFVLTAIELATPSGFFIIFFGLGAISVGVLTRFEVITGWWVEWLLFTGLSVAYLALFRRRLQSRFQNPPSSTVDSLVGVLAVATGAAATRCRRSRRSARRGMECAQHRHHAARDRPALSCRQRGRPDAGRRS